MRNAEMPSSECADIAQWPMVEEPNDGVPYVIHYDSTEDQIKVLTAVPTTYKRDFCTPLR